MTTTGPAPAQGRPTTSRRAVLGFALGGLAAGATAGAVPAAQAAAPSLPLAPVLPLAISDLAKGLQLTSSKYWHLARRVSPAPTAALAKAIRKTGYTRWIDRQLDYRDVGDSTANTMVDKHLDWATMTAAQADRATGGEPWKAGKALSLSRSVRQLFTNRHLYESMVDTMADHLYISADGKASSFVAWFDQSVLRKYALGKYSAMLAAATTHPAMLIYLDNHVNSADEPNENLGRELLELHTVGVGHYDEDDVRASALLLTGHGIDWSTLAHRFRETDHAVGPLSVMGFSHANAKGQGPAALKAYLSYLAHHEGTAHHIARRLAVRYVSDDPSEALVNTLADAYLDHDTSLAAVLRKLLLSQEFLDSVGQKWRRPQETMTAMIKARKPSTLKPAQKQTGDLWAIMGSTQWLLSLGNHQPRMWPVVDGYPDQAAEWMTTQSLLTHWNTAHALLFWDDVLAEFPHPSLASALGVKKGQRAGEVAAALTLTLTGYEWPPEHLALVVARLADSASAKLTRDQLDDNLPVAVHFIFASPYFQLR